jgi:2-methylcitrate dehydratase PrpD
MSENKSEQFLDHIDLILGFKLLPELEHAAKRCLLDFLGATFAGVNNFKSKLLACGDLLTDSDGSCTWIGFGRRVAPLNASFLNGMAAHAVELDDGVRFGMIHVGSPVFAALLAAVENKKLNGEAFLRGVVAGYEAAVLLSSTMQPDHYAKGFHPTATCGAVGAAIGVGVVSGYDRKQMKDTLSAVTIPAGGSLKIIEDDTALKPANAGRAAMSGLLSAYQAGAGFVGVDDPLAGRNGFINMMCGDERSINTSGSPSSAWINQVYLKPFAACRHSHAAIEAAQRIRSSDCVDVNQIRNVKITTYSAVIGKHDHHEIRGAAAARMSIPYGFAVAFVTGLAGVAQFQEPYIKDTEILSLTEKVVVCGDSELSALVPGKRVAIVEVTLENGSRFSERVDYPLGEPENPISDKGLENKFLELTCFAELSTEQAEQIINAVWSLPASMDRLYPLLAGQGVNI